MEKSHTQMLISEQEKEKAKFVFLKGMISKKPLMKWTVLKLWASVSKSPNQQMMVPVVVAVAEEVVVDHAVEVLLEVGVVAAKDHTEHNIQLPSKIFLAVAIGHS